MIKKYGENFVKLTLKVKTLFGKGNEDGFAGFGFGDLPDAVADHKALISLQTTVSEIKTKLQEIEVREDRLKLINKTGPVDMKTASALKDDF